MITYFKVSNFRSFDNSAEIEFIPIKRIQNFSFHYETIEDYSVLKTSAMYGGNASGKTNMIIAIEFIQKIISQKNFFRSDFFLRKYSKYKLSNSDAPSVFEIEFIYDKRLFNYEVRIDEKVIVYERLKEVYKDKNKKSTVYEFDKGSIELHGKTNYISNRTKAYLKDEIQHDFITSSIIANHDFFASDFLEGISNWFRKQVKFLYPFYKETDYAFLMVSNERFKENFNRFIRFADLGIEKVDVTRHELSGFYGNNKREEEELRINLKRSNDGYYQFNDQLGNPCVALREEGIDIVYKTRLFHIARNGDLVEFDLDQESRGTQALVSLIPAILLSYSENTMYFIDELNSSLHPILINEILFNYFNYNLKDANGQLVYNSHESFLIDERYSRPDEYWTIRNSPKEGSIIEPFTKYKAIRKDTRLQRNYLGGKLGGVPFMNRDPNVKLELI